VVWRIIGNSYYLWQDDHKRPSVEKTEIRQPDVAPGDQAGLRQDIVFLCLLFKSMGFIRGKFLRDKKMVDGKGGNLKTIHHYKAEK